MNEANTTADKDLVQQILGVQQTEIIEFLLEKTKNSNCPTCGTNGWQIMDPADGPHAFVQCKPNGDFDLPPPLMPVAVVICKNCYYVKTHALGGIYSWKVARLAASKTEG
jgi:hypothetical protein